MLVFAARYMVFLSNGSVLDYMIVDVVPVDVQLLIFVFSKLMLRGNPVCWLLWAVVRPELKKS